MRVEKGVPKVEHTYTDSDCLHGDKGKGALVGVGKNAAGRKRSGSGGVEDDDTASDEDDDEDTMILAAVDLPSVSSYMLSTL